MTVAMTMRDGTELVHFGTEYEEATVRRAPELLRSGTCVSFVGIGPSMLPYIPSHTRMVFRPVRPGERPAIGECVCVATKYGIDTHMVVKVRRNTFQMGSPQGWKMSWYRISDIVGYYAGSWDYLEHLVT